MLKPSLDTVRTLWDDLVRGAIRVRASEARGYDLLLERSSGEAKCRANHRLRQACCEAVLRGKPQKAVAADHGLTAATLAGMLKGGLGDMGIDSRFTQVPIAIPLLLHAASGHSVVPRCVAAEASAGEQLWQLSTSPLDWLLTDELLLPVAERDVMLHYLAGETYAEIAKARSTSPRTVANQLSTSFKRLGAAGRFSLIRTLVERGARRGRPLTLTLRATPPRDDDAPASASTFPSRPNPALSA